MGKEKYLRKVEELFEKSPVVSAGSISRIVRDKKKSNQYVKQLIRNLILKGKIKKLGNGFYTKYDESSLAVFCFEGYLGLQDALSFHDLWEQESIPIIITTKKIRQGIRQIMGGNVLIRRIDKKYFFGFEMYKEGEFYFPYADIEKTFIDMIYFREEVSEEALENLKKKIDKKKLENYLKKYPKKMRDKVLGMMKSRL